MGLIPPTSGKKKKYLSVRNGSIVLRAEEGTEGAVKRTTESGKDVWEVHYGGIEGCIKNIARKETEFGGKKIKSWTIDMFDPWTKEEFSLEMPYSSRYSSKFFRTIENADLKEPVRVVVGKFNDRTTGKEVMYLNLYQAETKLTEKYSKDSPGECPPLKQQKVKGEIVWDDSEQLEFFELIVKDRINPVVHKLFDSAPATAYDAVSGEAEVEPQTNDDLPF